MGLARVDKSNRISQKIERIIFITILYKVLTQFVFEGEWERRDGKVVTQNFTF